MMGDCCGPRERKRSGAASEEAPGTPGGAEAAAQAAGASSDDNSWTEKQPQQKPGLWLWVRVERAKGLIGMDFAGVDAKNLSMERTLDAYVTVSINEQPAFGKTGTEWQSGGSPVWEDLPEEDEKMSSTWTGGTKTEKKSKPPNKFKAEVMHPSSFLCLSAWDDDLILSRDHVGSMARLRPCGFLEIPLSLLPRNSTVTGWFTLNHPDLADSGGGLADRQEKLREADNDDEQEERQSAGQVKLELTLMTTAMHELQARAWVPAPVFKASDPPLNVPQFIADISEAKRLFLDRLLLAAIRSVVHALSWENKALSSAVLCWYIFLFFWPTFLWATVWFIVLLCFNHPTAQAPPPSPSRLRSNSNLRSKSFKQQEKTQGIIGGTFSGIGSVVGGVAGGAYAVLSKPIEGVRDGGKDGLVAGVRGLAVGVKDGLVEGVGKAAGGVVGGVTSIGGGVVGTVGSTVDLLTSVRGPGMMEFQQILAVKPALKQMVRGFQPTVQGVRSSLQTVDDLFYWGGQTTQKAVYAIMGALASALVLNRYMGILSWYGFLIGGCIVILAKAKLFKGFVALLLATVGILTRPTVPFAGCTWFSAEEEG